MAKYICTQQRPLVSACHTILTAAAFTLLSILLVLPASAQNGAPGGRRASPVLHIRINVVPVVQTPSPPEMQQQTGIVTYNVSTQQTSTEVIEKTSVLPGSVVGGNVGSGSIVLHTLTVVPK